MKAVVKKISSLGFYCFIRFLVLSIFIFGVSMLLIDVLTGQNISKSISLMLFSFFGMLFYAASLWIILTKFNMINVLIFLSAMVGLYLMVHYNTQVKWCYEYSKCIESSGVCSENMILKGG